MKPFFTESDCDVTRAIHYSMGPILSNSMGPILSREIKECQAISLEKANRLLSERGKVVTASSIESPDGWLEGHKNCGSCKLTALIINIEPIEPIEQDSAEKLLKDLIVKYEIAHNVPGTELGYNKFYERAKALLAKENK